MKAITMNMDSRDQLLAAATPLFARKGLHGVSVRELAKAAGVNVSMISYYFGGKDGLYQEVVKEQFSGLTAIARMAASDASPSATFGSYLLQCGICFHEGHAEEFVPKTASADLLAPECPHCLNNDTESFTQVGTARREAA